MEKRIFEEKFNNDKKEWDIFNDDFSSANIIEGSYIMEYINAEKGDTWRKYFFGPNLQMVESKAYSLEAVFTFLSGNTNNRFGFIWGYKWDEKAGKMLYQNSFDINSRGKFSIHHEDDKYHYTIKEWTECEFIKTGENEPNSLKIIKFDHNIDENLYFLINDQVVFQRNSLPLIGNGTGFVLFNNLKIKVDYFRVSYYSD
jgi:hypothetical protein